MELNHRPSFRPLERPAFRWPAFVSFTAALFLMGAAGFLFFRLLMLLANLGRLSAIPPAARGGVLLRAFLTGLRFDAAVLGYLLLLPLLAVGALALARRDGPGAYRAAFTAFALLLTLAFGVCAADIPYYRQFAARFSTAAFRWLDTPGIVAGMILQEVRYWIWALPLALATALLWWRGARLARRCTAARAPWNGPAWRAAAALPLLAVLLLLGIRGRLAIKAPLQVGTAFFSEYAFANQLGLNPVFTLLRSLLDDLSARNRRLRLLPDDVAVARACRTLGAAGVAGYDSPLARHGGASIPGARPANVIIVIMESMASSKLARYGNRDRLTPRLDALAAGGWSFDNVYTSGVHTYSGIYSCLQSFPVLLKQHPLKRVPILRYEGLAAILGRRGYQTAFFTTHDDQFDNMAGFLRHNGFQRVIAQDDYPAAQARSALGVPDHVMFDRALRELNGLHRSARPFLGVLLTASDHGPYVIPADIPFRPRQPAAGRAIVEYADWAIGRFVDACARQPWFDDTLFAFVADHGSLADEEIFEMPLSLHRTPLVFYAPARLGAPRSFSCLGGQIDVAPTLLGLLGQPYVNVTPGVDLLGPERPCIYFCDDEHIGCFDGRYFLVVRGLQRRLYDTAANRAVDQLPAQPARASALWDYAAAMLQASQWMVDRGRVGRQE